MLKMIVSDAPNTPIGFNVEYRNNKSEEWKPVSIYAGMLPSREIQLLKDISREIAREGMSHFVYDLKIVIFYKGKNTCVYNHQNSIFLVDLTARIEHCLNWH